MAKRWRQVGRWTLGLAVAAAAVVAGSADVRATVNVADLSITKTDGVTSVTAGGSTTYTVTASNAGPDPAFAPRVVDTFPSVLTATWTCVGAGGGTCTAAGSGNIDEFVTLPVGGSVTFTVSATISPSAVGTLSNTATVTSAGFDPDPGNDSATDTDTIVAQADLSVTKTDGVTTVLAGGSTTYTISASNAGPSDAPGTTVADSFPPGFVATWTCVGAGGGTCAAAGSGDISDTVNLPAGGSVTYTVTGTIAFNAPPIISNTATVAAPAGVTDPSPGNNSATDTDTVLPVILLADLSITKTDGVTEVTAGGSTTYTIVASNAGPSPVPAANVVDTFPPGVTVDWTCSGAAGGACNPAGSGALDELVNLPAAGSVTFTVMVSVPADAADPFVNVATIGAPAPVVDSNQSNNAATDADTLVIPPSTTTSTTTTSTTTTTIAPTTTAATTLAPTTSQAAVPPTPTTVPPAATASLPATGSSGPARIAPWGLALVLVGAGTVSLAARRRTRRL